MSDNKPHIDQVIVMPDVIEVYGHAGERKFSATLTADSCSKIKNALVDE